MPVGMHMCFSVIVFCIMIVECIFLVFSYIAYFIFSYISYTAMNALTTTSSSLLCRFVCFIGFLLPFPFLMLDEKVCLHLGWDQILTQLY